MPCHAMRAPCLLCSVEKQFGYVSLGRAQGRARSGCIAVGITDLRHEGLVAAGKETLNCTICNNRRPIVKIIYNTVF